MSDRPQPVNPEPDTAANQPADKQTADKQTADKQTADKQTVDKQIAGQSEVAARAPAENADASPDTGQPETAERSQSELPVEKQPSAAQRPKPTEGQPVETTEQQQLDDTNEAPTEPAVHGQPDDHTDKIGRQDQARLADAGQESQAKPARQPDGPHRPPLAAPADPPVSGSRQQALATDDHSFVTTDAHGTAALEESKERAMLADNDQDAGHDNDEHAEMTSAELERKRIDDEFFYDYDQLVSRPVVADGAQLPANLIEMHGSLGYDCHKRANLCVLDQDTLVFVAGNFVVFMTISTLEQTYLRSTGGFGIAHIAAHPSKNYLAVAEKGTKPAINIFEYPSKRLYRVQRGGTERAYAFVAFGPDGRFLASVGSYPDFMLTIWDWRQEHTVLRSKAFSQDVYRVSFSVDLDGFLTSAGSGHIKFWRMSDTFTGLKLQGSIGRFGKTEISDIEGFLDLPDGKVLSGSEWGNLLVWDGGLIKVEIGRKGKRFCHQGQIHQILIDEGEVITIGDDGFVRVWDFEAIDTAEPRDEQPVFELEPMNELRVPNCSLRHLVKSLDEDSTFWYGQDANGAIWKLDLSFTHTSLNPEVIYSCHAGGVADCSAAPQGNLLATIGRDGDVRIYDVARRTCICTSSYQTPGCSILWAPPDVDPRCLTILAGFNDGVVRSLQLLRSPADYHAPGRKTAQFQLLLRQVFKPHSSAVTSLLLNEDLSTLVTASQDGTVFFFWLARPTAAAADSASVSSAASDESGCDLSPIGFCRVAGPVTALEMNPFGREWPGAAEFILCMTANGFVLEVEVPKSDQADTSTSYELTLQQHQLKFRSVKAYLRYKEQMERKEKQFNQEHADKVSKLKRQYESGELEDEEFEERSKRLDAEKFEPDEFEPFSPEQPSPVLAAFYDETAPASRQLWLAMGDYDAGYFYQARILVGDELAEAQRFPDVLGQPTLSLPVVGQSADTPICCMHFLNQGRLLLMGMENGLLRVQQLDAPFQVGSLDKYWLLGMHDSQYGRIRRLCLNFDASALFSVGDDGNIFVYSLMPAEQLDSFQLQAVAELPPAARPEDVRRRIVDIDDPKAYSIEEAKRKAEYDKMVALAEQRKRQTRAAIDLLRSEFQHVLDANVRLPGHMQLSHDEMEIAASIRQDLARHIDAQVECVHEKFAWESERCRLQYEKLRRFFVDEIQSELVVVRSFADAEVFVSTFRTAKLGVDFYESKSQIELEETRMSLAREVEDDRFFAPAPPGLKASSADGGGLPSISGPAAAAGEEPADKLELEGDDEAFAAGGPGPALGDRHSSKTVLRGGMNERISRALQRVEQKKAKRQLRKQQWDELHESCPGDHYEDPQDVANIKWAKDNIGDFKLKSADNYQVPDELRMNANKARRRLVELRERVFARRNAYNNSVMQLRDQKRRLVTELRALVEGAHALQNLLPAECHKQLPQVVALSSEEVPEEHFEYDDKKLAELKRNLTEQEAGAGDGGPAAVGDDGAAGQTGKTTGPGAASKPALSMYARHSVAAAKVLTADQRIELQLVAADRSPLANKVEEIRRVRLVYQRDAILRQVEKLCSDFDEQLLKLRAQSFRLGVELKNADLRELTLFEELLLLKEYEIQESELMRNLQSRRQELSAVQQKLADVQERIDEKQRDIWKVQEEEKQMLNEFINNLADMKNFADFLTKVYKKKIKRKKKDKAGADSDSSESSSDDDSDLDESESEDEGDGPLLDLDTCPPGCSQAAYDEACKLREQRLDIEEVLTEERKNLDQLKKDLDGLQKRHKTAGQSLSSAEDELEAFQLAKQKKLNELDVTVSLKLSQIMLHQNGEIRRDLNQALVFESSNLERLRDRIGQLNDEIIELRKLMRDTRKKHVDLNKERRLLSSHIDQLQRRLEGEMLKKFGKVVDMQVLETIVVNKTLEALKQKVQEKGIEHDRELKEYERAIDEKRQQLIELTKDNTKLLEQLNMMSSERLQLEQSLDTVHKKLGMEYKGERHADVVDRQRLVQLVHLQAREIQALKEEIMVLSRKDGHILPPVHPPQQT